MSEAIHEIATEMVSRWGYPPDVAAAFIETRQLRNEALAASTAEEWVQARLKLAAASRRLAELVMDWTTPPADKGEQG